MSKMRMLLSAAVLLTSVALPLLGSAAAQAKNGADDPCPQHVEVGPNCQ